MSRRFSRAKGNRPASCARALAPLAVLVSFFSVACGPGVQAHAPAEGEKGEEPFVFAPLSPFPNFAVKQHVEWQAHGHTGSFDAVLQKHDEELVLIGLGPLGVRAFVLRQSPKGVTFEQSLGPKLPFPPRNIAIDVHRAYFKRLPMGDSGEYQGELDGEKITETWNGAGLQSRTFASSDAKRGGTVRVTFGKGCTRLRCAPESVRIESERHGYRLDISNEDYSFF